MTVGWDFIFTIYEGTDRSATVRITPEFSNVEAMRYLDSLLEQKNVLYMCGITPYGNTPEHRIVQKVFDSVEPSGVERREKFIDASDCDTAALLKARGAAELALVKDTESLDFDYLDISPTFTFGTHFFLGDFVTIEFPGIATIVSRIISVTEEWTSRGKTMRMSVGKQFPDLIRILKDDRRLAGALNRR